MSQRIPVVRSLFHQVKPAKVRSMDVSDAKRLKALEAVRNLRCIPPPSLSITHKLLNHLECR
jgi:hypothetical protein